MIRDEYDLLVIGGGINGVGIARDAAGRGLSVALCERGDLASATSSASSKLIHGGLRYLEHFEFRLVRESLTERAILLRNAPHIIRSLRFVLPHRQASRPAWMIRLGLFLYDRLGGSNDLPSSASVNLRNTGFGSGLRSEIENGFVYSDCRGDDARLVVLNARSAADLGATILPRAACVAAKPARGGWQVVLEQAHGARINLSARALVNAAGPWVREVLTEIIGISSQHNVRLVKGSHIVVPRQYSGEHAYLLQNDDHRVVFMIPFEQDFTLIGTTEVELQEKPSAVSISPQETEYLCRAANNYLANPVQPEQVLWGCSGIRPLVDDRTANTSAVSRDYVFELDDAPAPVLSVFGGKLTTYRKLAEHALNKLSVYFPDMRPAWTASKPLPGGDIPGADFERFAAQLVAAHRTLPESWLRSIASRHGSLAHEIIGRSMRPADLGECFGADLYACEIDYLLENEWAQSADDVLWRRTKCGLRLNPEQRTAVAEYIQKRRSTPQSAEDGTGFHQKAVRP